MPWVWRVGDHGDVCNGSETCDPARGCEPGSPLVCGDARAAGPTGCAGAAGQTAGGAGLSRCEAAGASTTDEVERVVLRTNPAGLLQ